MIEKMNENVYVAYARCATDSDSALPNSVEAQQAKIRNYVAALGGSIVGEFNDRATSGLSADRPGLRSLKAALSQGNVTAVVVSDPSRLGRGPALLPVLAEIESLGVRVEFASGQPIEGVAALLQMKQFADSVWVNQIRTLTKAKLVKMTAEGYFIGGKVPFGFRAEVVLENEYGYVKPPKRLVSDASSAPIVHQALNVFLADRSLVAVRQFLETAPQQTWSLSRIRRLLSNSVYLPLVGQIVFEEVQCILAEKTVMRKN